MTVLAVDLAARYSAACLVDDDATVLWQVDSWGQTEGDFIHTVISPWTIPDWYRHASLPAVLVVEDLPHRLPFSSLVKRVARIQGRIVEAMDRHHATSRILFLPPAVWRKHYPGLGRGTGSEAVVPVAASLGYTAPDLSDRIRKAGDRATARKVTTDYCAAYLIARWSLHTYAEHGSFDAPGTSRYIR